MIKSLLDDEEDRNGEEEPRSGFLKKSFRSEEILSIDLSSEPDEEPSGPGESEEEIRKAIVLGPPTDSNDPPPVDLRRSGPSEPETAEPDPMQEHERRASELERKLHEIEEELRKERESLRAPVTERTVGQRSADPPPSHAGEGPEYGDRPVSTAAPGASSVPSFGTPPEAESSVETFRKSGMAWSAAIALFGSVVFMLVLGWFADLLIGSSPWGVVFGIVLGSVVGFVQFFRITSQILRPARSDFDRVSLKSDESSSENEGAPE